MPNQQASAGAAAGAQEPAGDPVQYRGHILPLDGLRGAGMLAVLLFHAFFDSNYPAAPGSWQAFLIRFTSLGAAGMTMFFSLSGFLITGILLDSVEKPHYWKNFYVRRALRILPAYLLMLVVLFAGHFVSGRFVLACLLYIGNMARLVGARSQEYGVMWTLAVEEQFYLIWPLFVRYVGRSKLLWLTLAGVVLTPFFRLLLASHGIETFLNTPSNVDCILSGALLAILLRNGTIHRGNIRKVSRWLAWVSGLLLLPIVLIALHGFSSRPVTVFMAAFKQPPILGLFAAYALWAVARHRKGGPAPSRTLRFFVFFGDISYGLYLVHQLVFRLYDKYTVHSVLGGFNSNFGLLFVRFLITSLIATGIAWLSRRYFEDLFLAQKNRLAPYKGDPQKPSVPEPGVLPGMETS
ncbi:acyltransferase [Acidipila sp. EB88]|uniref:acyltransferase family protein n=1 Tax=Acidipila sp. EB88 TaxID=2305226 RepID=UPI0013151807|nr:acyltransferase [Acidipila sp. EB88]